MITLYIPKLGRIRIENATAGEIVASVVLLSWCLMLAWMLAR